MELPDEGQIEKVSWWLGGGRHARSGGRQVRRRFRGRIRRGVAWRVSCDGNRVSNVTVEHEAPLEVLRDDPALIIELLRLVGHPPSGEGLTSKLEPSGLNESRPSVHSADLVSSITDGAGVLRHIVVVEVQRDVDDKKLRTWPLYVAYLSARHDVPVTLLVLAFDPAVARWARAQPDRGPNLHFVAFVIGPDELPTIRSENEVLADLGRAMLTALARSARLAARSRRDRAAEAEVVRIFRALFQLSDRDLRTKLLRMILATARGPLRATLETILKEHGMSWEQVLQAHIKAEGKAEGKAEDVLKVLQRRGFELTPDLVQRVHAATDITQLDAWFDRALDATRLEDVFQS